MDTEFEDVPKNDPQKSDHSVHRTQLIPLLERLNENSNIVRVEYVKFGGSYKVRVYYAIMDLATQIAAVSNFVDHAVSEAKNNQVRA